MNEAKVLLSSPDAENHQQSPLGSQLGSCTRNRNTVHRRLPVPRSTSPFLLTLQLHPPLHSA